MHELRTQIEYAIRQINRIHGSLEAMRGIEDAVQEVLLNTNLCKQHVHHMKVSERVFQAHRERLIEEQTELITLLTKQQQMLRAISIAGPGV